MHADPWSIANIVITLPISKVARIMLTMTWSQPDFCIMLATSFAEIGARLLSFLSCLEYGNNGNTAVILFALAILHACIMMQSSISAVFTAPQAVLMMYTSFSRTLSAIRTLVSPMPLLVTSAFESDRPRLEFIQDM